MYMYNSSHFFRQIDIEKTILNKTEAVANSSQAKGIRVQKIELSSVN